MEGCKRYEGMTNMFARVKNDDDFAGILKDRTNSDIRYHYNNKINRIREKVKRIADRAREEPYTGNDGEKEEKPTAKPKKPEDWIANEAEAKLLITAIGKHGQGKWREVKQDLLQQPDIHDTVQFEEVSEEQLRNYWMSVKDKPTEHKLGICISCNHFSCSFHGDREVDFPRVSVGNNPKYYMTTCKVCLRMRVAIIAMFFSPLSGSDLETQEFVLKKCYNNHLTLVEASKLIDMDHDVEFKLEGIATMITRRNKDPLEKEIQICQEILQGRCVPMEQGDHAVKTETDRPRFQQQNDYRDERKRYLKTARESVDTVHLLRDVFKLLLGSRTKAVDNFIKSKIFWGYREDGTRPKLTECLNALRQLRVNMLHEQIKEKPALLYFIKLGHERRRIVKAKVPDEELPDDFKEIEAVLQEAEASGPIQPPMTLVTATDIEQHIWDSDSEEEDEESNAGEVEKPPALQRAKSAKRNLDPVDEYESDVDTTAAVGRVAQMPSRKTQKLSIADSDTSDDENLDRMKISTKRKVNPVEDSDSSDEEEVKPDIKTIPKRGRVIWIDDSDEDDAGGPTVEEKLQELRRRRTLQGKKK